MWLVWVVLYGDQVEFVCVGELGERDDLVGCGGVGGEEGAEEQVVVVVGYGFYFC